MEITIISSDIIQQANLEVDSICRLCAKNIKFHLKHDLSHEVRSATINKIFECTSIVVNIKMNGI